MTTHIIRAKLMHDKRTYRDTEIPSQKSLYHLAEAIIQAFDFDFDHAFGYYSKLGSYYHDSEVRYELFVDMDMDGGESLTKHRPKAKGVKRTKIYTALTAPKQKLQFLFDYGDEWRFEIELRGFGTKTKGTRYPRLLAVKGDSPAQYPDWDDEDDDDEE